MLGRVVGADRSSRLAGEPEFEYVVIEQVDQETVEFVLDDGERLVFDAAELRSALDEADAA